jgi:hypothetical protein
MSLLDACKWLEASRVSTGIRHSKWGFASIEMVHLLALALLGGALLITALRVFGLLFQPQRAGDILRDLWWILVGSVAASIVSGVLLFADGPLRYYANVAFRWKLLLIGAAMLSGIITHLIGRRGESQARMPWTMKVTASLACTFFLGAAVAGRVIGVL